MSGHQPDLPSRTIRDVSPHLDADGVMHCPALHAPGIPEQGNTGSVQAMLPQAGDMVVAGQIVMRIETDFAYVDVQSPVDGVIEEFLVSRGRTISTGEALWRYSRERF